MSLTNVMEKMQAEGHDDISPQEYFESEIARPLELLQEMLNKARAKRDIPVGTDVLLLFRNIQSHIDYLAEKISHLIPSDVDSTAIPWTREQHDLLSLFKSLQDLNKVALPKVLRQFEQLL